MGFLTKDLLNINIQNKNDGGITISGIDNYELDQLHYLKVLFLCFAKCLFDLGNQTRLVGALIDNLNKNLAGAISDDSFEITNMTNNVLNKLNTFYDFDVKDHLKIDEFVEIDDEIDPNFRIGESFYTLSHSRFNKENWLLYSNHTLTFNNILIPINITALSQKIIIENLLLDKFLLKIAQDLGNKIAELDRDDNFLKLRNIGETQDLISGYINGVRTALKSGIS